MVAALSFLASPKSAPPPAWLFFVLFAGTWVVVSFVISRASGWVALAGYYRADHPFDGPLIRFQAAQFRKATNYNGCLSFGSDDQGMYMVPMLFFRAFHPPLMIPWSDITARPVKLWRLWNFVELRFQRVPDIPVRIKQSLAEKLAEASAGRFSAVAAAVRN